ncbi:DUF7002 family protein [Roseovarius sp. D22-M7]|uniref:DUF7002 family protein n=1 Tax=Roseovarius sp. D22-M7 TaxID=3127116 RepID=UPI0030105306
MNGSTPGRGACNDVLRAIGPHMCHVTARSNLDGIVEHGLCSAADLARRCGRAPKDMALRRDRKVLTLPGGATARLNHQLPILHGRRAADTIVDGFDARGWACQLDERIFLWPARRGEAFGRSIAKDADSVTLWFDTARLLGRMADHLWLAPFNTGNFRQGGARAQRGSWIYRPVTDGLADFRSNRQRRGLVKRPDRIVEISLTAPLPPDMVADLLLATA